MTVAIRPVVQRSVSKSQVVAPRRRRRGSCRCCAVVNFGGRPGAGFAVKALRPRRRTASRQRITELCEHPSRRATSVTDAPAFSSSIPRRRRRSSSSGLPCGRMPRQYRARHQMSITYAHVNKGALLLLGRVPPKTHAPGQLKAIFTSRFPIVGFELDDETSYFLFVEVTTQLQNVSTSASTAGVHIRIPVSLFPP